MTDAGLRVTDDKLEGHFTREIFWRQLDLGIDDNGHLFKLDERYWAALMRQ